MSYCYMFDISGWVFFQTHQTVGLKDKIDTSGTKVARILKQNRMDGLEITAILTLNSIAKNTSSLSGIHLFRLLLLN